MESVDALSTRIGNLVERKDTARECNNSAATERQHARGKLTAHERIDVLFDKGSFTELEALRRHRATAFGMDKTHPPSDGVVCGWGTVEGRTVFAYAHDFRVFGGSLGEAHAQKIHKIMDLAEDTGAPLVGLNDGAGARIQEGVIALAGYGGIFQRNARCSGVIPQISVILGPCAGGATYSPALTDFIFMVRGTSQMFITGPDVVQAVTGEEFTQDALGGADAHSAASGVASFIYDDESTCLEDVRHLLSLLPANNLDLPPVQPTADPADRSTDALLDIVPVDPKKSYDMRLVIEEVFDDGAFFESHSSWASNMLCGFASLNGNVVGIVANQPQNLSGVLDINASEKAARFVQTCDAFNIPLVSFVDVPGFLPGSGQEHGGIIRHGAKLLYAYCNASVPRVQLVLRKAYGGAYIVMDSRSIGADLSLAFPTNEIAVMGAEAATEIIFRKEIANAEDSAAVREQKTEEYQSELMHPYYAAEYGLVDEVIDPRATRRVLVHCLDMLRTKRGTDAPRRKHGNPPV